MCCDRFKTMDTMHRRFALIISFAAVTAASAQIPTARVGDITHLQGQGRNVLIGYGLVTGLAGTGDGGKFLPTMKAVAEMVARFGVQVDSIRDVESAKNTAVVMVEAVVPEHGGREGELLDLQITAVAAKSLVGGRLLSTPLIYHDRGVDGLFAFGSGRIIVEGMVQTSGYIRQGGRLERNIFVNVLAEGKELRSIGLLSPWIRSDQTYLTLVLDDAHAGWSMATAIAQAVDKELSISADVERVALAVDSKNIVVLLPAHQLGDPASWIRDVERTPILMESGEARVTINRRTGTIVVTGDTPVPCDRFPAWPDRDRSDFAGRRNRFATRHRAAGFCGPRRGPLAPTQRSRSAGCVESFESSVQRSRGDSGRNSSGRQTARPDSV